MMGGGGFPAGHDELTLRLFDLYAEPPVILPAAFIRITGGLLAGQFLRHAVHAAPPGEWFHLTREDWARITYLDRYGQEEARRDLKRLDLLEEKRTGTPPKMWYRVNRGVLLSRIAQEAFEAPPQESPDVQSDRTEEAPVREVVVETDREGKTLGSYRADERPEGAN